MAMQATPIIPQTKITFKGTKTPQIKPSVGATVAIPLTHDWGPMGSELAGSGVLAEFAEWTNLYGESDTDARTAVAGAFAGQDVLGAGGAGGVIPYRMGATPVRATLTLMNTAGTPVAGVVLTAKWCGTRGNAFSAVVDVDPVSASNARLRLKYRGTVVETYTYAEADLAALVAAINARNLGNVTATLSNDGVKLAAISDTSLASGTNGTTPDGAAHLAAQDALEFQPFTVLAPANLTDGAIRLTYRAFAQSQEANNRPHVLVTGGAAGESLSTALTRSAAMADPHIVNVGVGTYHDDLLNKDLGTAQLAPRFAGILAAKGRKASLTGSEIGGLHVVGTTGVSQAEAEVAIQQGLTVMIRTDSEEADLRVAKGVTTFTDDSDAARPVYIFSEPRFIRIMDLFIRDMRAWGDKYIIGATAVNQDTRDAVRQYGGQLIDALLLDGLILTKAQGADEDPFIRTPVTTNDTVPFDFGWQFAQTTNFLLGNGDVR